MFRFLFASACALLAVAPLTAAPNPDPNEAVRLALQSELEDFALPSWNRRPEVLPPAPEGSPFVPAAGPAVEDYRRHLLKVAPWGSQSVWHQMGKLPLPLGPGRSVNLGFNVFQPPGPSRGTLVFVHGYMSHSANFAYTFAAFTARGWSVVTLDLPGHGFSEGVRSDIEDWSEYGDAVALALKWAFGQGWPGPRVLAAHSLGTAASLEGVRRRGTVMPDHLVFCAPLLRTDWHPFLALGEAALGWWLKDFPSSFGWDGYLDGYVMPVHWFGALNAWLRKIERQAPVALPLTIYSGDRDEVVDEDWNRAAYRRLVPGAQYVLLPGKGHLFLTNRSDREAFQRLLGQAVDQWERR